VRFAEPASALPAHHPDAQEKRTMKVGLDLALGVGQKLNENKTMDHKSLNKEGRSEAANKAFTISK
jgi:hypothetical protein